MEKERIWKYIIGEGNSEERLLTIRWIKADQERIAIYHRLKRDHAIMGVSSHITDEYIDEKYDRLKREINRGTNSIAKYLLKVTKYAAVIIMTAVISWFLFVERNEQPWHAFAEADLVTIETLPGQSLQTTLPDGTVVWLNGASGITYSPDIANQSSRNIKLSGEAFFDVEHNPDRPFRILAESLTVKVLGTSFNVEAYPNEGVRTTLVEGKVQLGNIEDNNLAILTPGNQARYLNDVIDIVDVNVDQYVGWKDGYIAFEDTEFGEIALRLERFYNVDIEFSKESARHVKISGKALKNVPVENLFEILKLTFNINYEITKSENTNNKIIIK